MNRATKRPAQDIDYRARSPKRRKENGTVRQPHPVRATHKQYLAAAGIEAADTSASSQDGELHPVRAILKERTRGRRIEYLIDWDGSDPDTGKPYPPSWEPAHYVTSDIAKAWRKEKKDKRLARDQDYQPTQQLEGSLAQALVSSLNGIASGSPARRPKTVRRVIRDSSSDIEVGRQLRQNSHTPTLASTSTSTPTDNFNPDSPSLEILDSQQQPSGPSGFSVNIPTTAIDKADYESYHSSQGTYLNKTPPSTASISEQRSLRSSHKLNRPAVSSPLTDGASQFLHQRLLQAVESSSPIPSTHIVQIPASAENSNPQQETRQSQLALHSPVIESSPAATSTKRVIKQANLNPLLGHKPRGKNRLVSSSSSHTSSGARKGTANLYQFLSSAQEPTPLAASGDSGLSSFNPICQPTLDSQSSRSWAFQPQSVTQAVLSQGGESNLVKAGRTRARIFGRPVGGRREKIRSNVNNTSERSTQKSQTNMDLPVLRQSPRLRASTPVKGPLSPRIGPEEQSYPARTPQKGDEADSPQDARAISNAPALSIQDYSTTPYDSGSKPTSTPLFASAQPYAQRPSGSTGLPEEQQSYDQGFGSSALPIQSIEEGSPSSPEESIASKASSSQASLENERIIAHVDGVNLPLQPVLGPAEYTIPLAAEGKIQSAYADTIKAKRKAILKFINRRDSVGSANGSVNRTKERNEMIELIDRLHDTTTHFDLGLPGFATQFSIRSDEDAAYAEYAGAKFVFLGYLVEALKNADSDVVIASKPGPVQDLIADFLRMKHAHVTKHDRPTSARSTTPDYHRATLKIDLVDTTSDMDIRLSSRPALLIAFDTTFDNQSPQIKRIRELNSRGRNQLLPVVHLLTTNSSEHIDRCLRKSMPSPQRLKLLVRGTYQAKAHLGGLPTYVPDPSDEPEGKPMQYHDLQRAVRKSPNRKLEGIARMIAHATITEDFEQHWTLGAMPEVQYEELEDTPPKLSERSTAPGTANATPRDGRARSRTPLSGVGTPSGKKRLLDPDDVRIQTIFSKRQRMSPLRDVTPIQDAPKDQAPELEQLKEQVESLQAELAAEKAARIKAEIDLGVEKERSASWEKAHNIVIGRYDKRRIKQHQLDKENKRLQGLIDSGKEKQEKVAQMNNNLKEQMVALKTELNTAREELKSSIIPEIAALETARAEARGAQAKAASMEKQLENKNQDFEFTRQQYQQASTRAAELGQENTELEARVEVLKVQASDERRRLREINFGAASKKDLERIDALEQEKKSMERLLKRTREEMELSKKGRGVQTRGSSVQPPGSPGVVGIGMGTRSRQGSPAPGTVLSSAADARRDALGAGGAGAGGSVTHPTFRGSGLRNQS